MDEKSIRCFLQEEALKLRLEVRPEVTSTNTVLKEYALAGEPEGKVLLAQRQTAGKGRRGRSFYSPEDTGLYMSILLRPQMGAEDSLLITTAAAAATAEAIEKVTGQPSEIKWVNDVYCHGKKVVGILTEGGMEQGSSQLSYAVLGIGINLWPPSGGFPPELARIAGSVMPTALSTAEEQEKKELRSRLAAAVLNEFMKIYPHIKEKQFMKSYRKRSFLIGRTVTLMTADHRELTDYPAVKVVDIGDDAQLIVELPNGERREMRSGEVSVKMEE